MRSFALFLGFAVLAAPLLHAADAQGFRDRIRQKMEERRAEMAKNGPRDTGATRMTIAGRQVDIWRPANASGPVPLILFSHGFGGCGTQSSFLMKALAEAGYLVVAPNHKDARCANGDGGWQPGAARPTTPFREPEKWTGKTYVDRRDDMQAVLAAVLADPSFHADPKRIGLVGHSLGGYTVLGLAGGWQSWKTDGIRAVVALSPFCAPFATAGTLGGVAAPVEYQGGTRDIGVTPVVSRKDGCYDGTPSPAAYVELDGAGHFAWTDLQQTGHEVIVRDTLAWLDRYVRGIGVPPVPPKGPGVSEQRAK